MSDFIEGGDEPQEEIVAIEPPGEAPEAVPQPAINPETEALARKYGWKPKAESTLPDGSWMDADRFVAASKTRVRILGDQLAETDRRAAAAEAMARSAADTVRRQERARFNAELASIREQKLVAVETADQDAYKALEAREARLVSQPQQQAESPELAAYRATESGKWVNDPVLFRAGYDALEAELARGVQMGVHEQFAFAERAVRDYFPHKFTPPPPLPPREPETGRFSRVDGGGLATGRTSASHGLSAEDYAAAKSLVARGTFKDVGEYAAYAKKLGVIE